MFQPSSFHCSARLGVILLGWMVGNLVSGPIILGRGAIRGYLADLSQLGIQAVQEQTAFMWMLDVAPSLCMICLRAYSRSPKLTDERLHQRPQDNIMVPYSLESQSSIICIYIYISLKDTAR